jgi:Cu-Zn family superoxide dismutase
MTLRIPSALAVSGLALALAGSAGAQEPVTSGTDTTDSGTIMARLATAEGVDVGSVTFRGMRAGVNVAVDLTDLPPGPHAIHIHETGACTPDFDAAGEHLSPDGHEHGFAKTETPHAGDLPNLVAADDGTAQAEFVNWRLTLEDLLDDDGSAVIVHTAADSYMDPASAGDRYACGVVEQLS